MGGKEDKGKPGLATEPERSVSEPESAPYPRGREAATPGPPRRERGDRRRRGLLGKTLMLGRIGDRRKRE